MSGELVKYNKPLDYVKNNFTLPITRLIPYLRAFKRAERRDL